MNSIDGSEHYVADTEVAPPALLTVILDINPQAWADFSLPLDVALGHLIVFINAHLALSASNKIAVLASYPNQTKWLYPTQGRAPTLQSFNSAARNEAEGDDENMEDVRLKDVATAGSSTAKINPVHANKYPPFRIVEEEVRDNLEALLGEVDIDTLAKGHPTRLAGALSVALMYTNKQNMKHNLQHGLGESTARSGGVNAPQEADAALDLKRLQSRICVISMSDDDTGQYLPSMNAIFAAQKIRVLIDTLQLIGDSAYLQQAAKTTKGRYMKTNEPRGLIQTLMLGYLPDQTARQFFASPGQEGVDYRSTCFCHKKVIDIGFVCSVCLSIFCEPLDPMICLVCSTELSAGDYGAKPAVVQKKKKKKKRNPGTGNGTPASSNVGTPAAS
ncbi:MAG: RNA polymerase II transcription factor B subunit 4 [Vezdaea aestivalis]|nr:MAG: RNA polymerase II transcription factor B subunit 4 [Vezdaea aestivalis]